MTLQPLNNTMEYNIKIKDDLNIKKRLSKEGFKSYDSGILYKYVSFESALKILQNNSLMYSLPITFNDPFDLATDFLDCSISENQVIDMVKNEFVTTDLQKEIIIQYAISNPNVLPNAFLERLEHTKSNIGITCFSKSHMKTLMWSHYADKHQGICIGFKFKETFRQGLIQLTVKYVSEIKPVNYFSDTLFGIYNWLFSKSNIWEYEEEVRRVYVDKTGLIKFDPLELKEVYFGVNTSKEKIQTIQNLLSEKKYKLQKQGKMIINPKTFDLKEEDS